MNEGWCTSRLNRYYFDYFTQKCAKFSYTGCGGNENNFYTFDECQDVCANLDLNYTAQAIAMSGHGLQFEDMLPTNCKITEWTEWSDCSGKTNFVEQKVLNKNFK